jgi:hypothetical protein
MIVNNSISAGHRPAFTHQQPECCPHRCGHAPGRALELSSHVAWPTSLFMSWPALHTHPHAHRAAPLPTSTQLLNLVLPCGPKLAPIPVFPSSLVSSASGGVSSFLAQLATLWITAGRTSVLERKTCIHCAAAAAVRVHSTHSHHPPTHQNHMESALHWHCLTPSGGAGCPKQDKAIAHQCDLRLESAVSLARGDLGRRDKGVHQRHKELKRNIFERQTVSCTSAPPYTTPVLLTWPARDVQLA